MGAKGKAFTLVGREQGEQLTKVENLINMVIQQAKLEGFEPRPEPSDWTLLPPGSATDSPPKPVISRFERPYGVSTATAAATTADTASRPAVALPPRTIGSKIPINRRHKRRR